MAAGIFLPLGARRNLENPARGLKSLKEIKGPALSGGDTPYLLSLTELNSSHTQNAHRDN